jgi:hypothetical protein
MQLTYTRNIVQKVEDLAPEVTPTVGPLGPAVDELPVIA